MEGVFVAAQVAAKHREREGPERRLVTAKTMGVAGKTNDLRRSHSGELQTSHKPVFPANLEGPVNSMRAGRERELATNLFVP